MVVVGWGGRRPQQFPTFTGVGVCGGGGRVVGWVGGDWGVNL